MIKLKKITLREATKEDSKFLFNLRNDAVVRKNSISQERVSPKEHRDWFSKSLFDEDKHTFIIVFDGSRIGQVRFDEKNGGAEINLALHKFYRGKGIGDKVLTNACKIGFSDLNFKYILGRIKKHNIASIKIFKRNGFKKERGKNNLLIMKLSNDDKE